MSDATSQRLADLHFEDELQPATMSSEPDYEDDPESSADAGSVVSAEPEDTIEDGADAGINGIVTETKTPRSNHGVAFNGPQDLMTYLRFNAHVLGDNETLVDYAVQQKEGKHKTWVFITTDKVGMVRTQDGDEPVGNVFVNPQSLEIEAEELGTHSNVIITHNDKPVRVSDLAAGDAKRIKILVENYRFKDRKPPTDVPKNLVFDAIYPIEYYEVKHGMKNTVIQSFDYKAAAIDLEYVATKERGFFRVVIRDKTDDGDSEDRYPFEPFRENKKRLFQGEEPPYNVRIVPVDDHMTSMQALEGLGVLADDEAELLTQRYRREEKISHMDAMFQLCEILGLEMGDPDNGFMAESSPTHVYLVVRGNSFVYNHDGDAVQFTMVHES